MHCSLLPLKSNIASVKWDNKPFKKYPKQIVPIILSDSHAVSFMLKLQIDQLPSRQPSTAFVYVCACDCVCTWPCVRALQDLSDVCLICGAINSALQQ